MGIDTGISLLNSIYSSIAANKATQQKQLSGQYAAPRMLFVSGASTDTSVSASNSNIGTITTSDQQNQASGQNPAYKVAISTAGKTAAEIETAQKYGLPKWWSKYDAPLNDLSSPLANKMTNEWSQQRSALQTQLNQYGEYTHTALLAAMKAVGASDTQSYNAMVANDPSVGDRAEAAFKQTLLSMPNASSLMSRLNVAAANVS
jgi:hypothetical protein